MALTFGPTMGCSESNGGFHFFFLWPLIYTSFQMRCVGQGRARGTERNKRSPSSLNCRRRRTKGERQAASGSKSEENIIFISHFHSTLLTAAAAALLRCSAYFCLISAGGTWMQQPNGRVSLACFFFVFHFQFFYLSAPLRQMRVIAIAVTYAVRHNERLRQRTCKTQFNAL